MILELQINFNIHIITHYHIMSLVIVYTVSKRTYPQKSSVQPSKVDYNADIQGKFALCRLTQTFELCTDNIIEGFYEFPVDYNSAFCDLSVKTPREHLRGVVREKSEAKKMFEDAKKEGRQAFLTQQSDSDRDVYKLSMSNLLNGDIIIVEYTYVTELEYNEGKNIFYVPSFISPRYGGNFIPNSNHALRATVKINGNITSLKCSMPDTTISLTDGCSCVEYTSTFWLKEDIEITYNASFENKAYKFNVNDHSMVVTQVAPHINSSFSNHDIVFVLDCSGSMDGERMDNSIKAVCHCLAQMVGTAFNFNILRYGSSFDKYLPESLPTTVFNIKNAITYCRKIKADLGGTETYNALRMCLDMSKTAILITDGDTSDNEEMHKLCRQFDCLSILGIGSGINRANIKDMARNGKGIALFSQTDSNIIQNMNQLFMNVSRPSVSQPIYSWSSTSIEKVALTNRSPIVSNHPNMVFAILNDVSDVDEFRIRGVDCMVPIEPYLGPLDTKYIGCLVAKRIIQENDISEMFTKEQMVELAVKFGIITKYTSMIAVSSLHVKTSATISDETVYVVATNQISSVPHSGAMMRCMDLGMTLSACAVTKESMFFDASEEDEECMENGLFDSSDGEESMPVIKHKCANKGKKKDESEDEDFDEDFDVSTDDNTDNSTDNTSDEISKAVKWFKSQQINLDENIFYHFNKSVGLFNQSVRQLLTGIDASILRDDLILSVFVMICITMCFDSNVYDEYLLCAMKNADFVELAFKFNLV
ncbi:hypothetical protein QJ857_gp0728 [Tupanvirus soda lake]|uniref:Uncharacterized protein n=2 Tax=Tupanvirus TaxID=2094720 RepID=A0A6N1NMX9_9VIRU|nr:hypothetical protein QJ857_gp0728 [Tupanvirus soda lake]QKU35320.1 hypothetical protein [Tupanvirus soda lake]